MKFLALILLLSVSTFASVIEAPEIGVDFQQNPSGIDWQHITTDHFDIIFPKEIGPDAQRVAHLLEKAYPFVTRSLEVKPVRIPLILQNQSVQSNGFVTLAPRRSEWYVTPSIDPEVNNTEWLKTLSIHEFRHVVQFQKTRQGFNKFLAVLLGEIGQGLGLGLTLPPWFFEGDAVGMETALTRGGRGRLPMFDRDLRTLLLSGKNWNYDKAHLGSYDDYIPNHYVYGYFYTSFMRNKYGDLFLSHLTDASAQRSYNPLTFYNASEELTNQKFEKFYKEVMRDLIKEWKAKADLLSPTPYTVKSLQRRFGWTNYYYPQVTEDKKVLALKKGLSFIEQFVLLDGKEEKSLFYPASLQNEYPYKLRNGKFAFVEAEVDPRWGYRDYSRIRVFDLNSKKFVLSKGKTKARLAVLDHSGDKMVYIDWHDYQSQDIVVLDNRGKEILRIPHPPEEVITSIDWLNQEDLVFVSKDRSDLKAIMKLNLNTLTVSTLLEKDLTNIGHVSVEEDHIFYESPKSGIDNIWLLTNEGPRQITSALFGSYAPDISDGKLVYNDYTVNGMNVVEKTHSWEEEQKSSDSFYPIYEKFAASENFDALESEYLKTETRKVKKYSQFKHAVNLHSWVLLAPPLSSTITVMGFSQDVLNKFSLQAGVQYNLNEQTTQGFVGASWSHLYPVFDLRGAYGNRRQDISLSGRSFENKWEEGTFEAGVQIPWRYLKGRFTHAFTTRAFSKIIKVTNKITSDRSEVSDGALFSPGIQLSYSVYSRLARRDINPAWAFFLNAQAEEGKDITGNGMKGSLQSVDSRVYLPGLWHHHSFYHQMAYERQRNDSYEYASFVMYPRGTRSIFLQELNKYSANYTMPLFYPDWNLSRYFYLKRVSMNLFYDQLNGRYFTTSYKAASTGWEVISEMNFVRIFIPLSIGVRGSYVLDGIKKESNYEIFLASVLGTF
jgi:predicted transport protein